MGRLIIKLMRHSLMVVQQFLSIAHLPQTPPFDPEEIPSSIIYLSVCKRSKVWLENQARRFVAG
jgi:hypothetical protein